MTTPETLTPDEADKLMTSGDGCCMFCEVDLNLGRGHGDWCKWPVIRAAWEMDLLCHKSFVEHHKSVDEQCLDLIKRLEEAEKDRRWLVDYAHKGPWATINDYREFDRIAASVGEKP
jgi:hypothetical protein